jgi:hypothetical protein
MTIDQKTSLALQILAQPSSRTGTGRTGMCP